MARQFLLSANLGGFEIVSAKPVRVRGRLAFYSVTCRNGTDEGSISVDADSARVDYWTDNGRLFAAQRAGSSGDGRFESESEALSFARALGRRLYGNRDATVASFERKGALWELHASYAVQRHSFPFVDRPFGFAVKIAARDGALLSYSERYGIPQVEAPPATPITKAQAYRVATGSSMPAGSAVEATLGYALPQGTTSGTAVLCWRLRFSKTRAGEATVIYYVDAKRATVIKRSVLK